ncbi:MAG: DUF2845 domain-containing protein [Candidatus Omnitrophica bacterium]|nr:DUF2845 domain-containing protein [Candidatus Omnitrophota bacterium]
MKKILSFFICFLLTWFVTTSVCYSGTQKKYYRLAAEYLAEADSLYSENKLYQAYDFYDKAISSAEASDQLERLSQREIERIKDIIRQSNNGKSRIHQVTQNFRSTIQAKRVSRGMSKSQVLASWGDPSDIEKKIYKWQEQEVWSYGNVLDDSDKFVIFQNGLVIDWRSKDDQ